MDFLTFSQGMAGKARQARLGMTGIFEFRVNLKTSMVSIRSVSRESWEHRQALDRDHRRTPRARDVCFQVALPTYFRDLIDFSSGSTKSLH